MSPKKRSSPPSQPNPYEAECRRLRDELFLLRQFVTGQTPDPFPGLLERYVFDQRHMKRSSEPFEELVDLVIEATRFNAETRVSNDERANCPLCNRTTLGPYPTGGFTIPTGLERHLTGSSGARQCMVMRAAHSQALAVADSNAELGPHWKSVELGPFGPELEEVVAHDSQRHLPAREVRLWEIRAFTDPTSRLEQKLPIPLTRKLVRGGRDDAEDLQGLLTRALRWGGATELTRIWLGVGIQENGALVLNSTLNYPGEEPELPVWDPSNGRWLSREHVVVSLRADLWRRLTQARAALSPSSRWRATVAAAVGKSPRMSKSWRANCERALSQR